MALIRFRWIAEAKSIARYAGDRNTRTPWNMQPVGKATIMGFEKAFSRGDLSTIAFLAHRLAQALLHDHLFLSCTRSIEGELGVCSHFCHPGAKIATHSADSFQHRHCILMVTDTPYSKFTRHHELSLTALVIKSNAQYYETLHSRPNLLTYGFQSRYKRSLYSRSVDLYWLNANPAVF